MGQLIVDLIPVTLGVVLSPLAIMALIAILVSARARTNGLTYLVGWILGILVVLLGATWVFATLGVRDIPHLPAWVSVVLVAIGSFLIIAATWTYLRGHAHVVAMSKAVSPQDVVSAAPQLPGWLQAP